MDNYSKIEYDSYGYYYIDEMHRLHNDTGPASCYKDGNQYWYWHGERLYHITSQEQFEQWLKLKAFW